MKWRSFALVIFVVFVVVAASLLGYELSRPTDTVERVGSVDAEGLVRVSSIATGVGLSLVNPRLAVIQEAVNMTIHTPPKTDPEPGYVSSYFSLDEIEWVSFVDRNSSQVVVSYFQPHHGWLMPFDGRNFTIATWNVRLDWIDNNDAEVRISTLSDGVSSGLQVDTAAPFSAYRFELTSQLSRIELSAPGTNWAIWEKISPTEYESTPVHHDGSQYIMRIESVRGFAYFPVIGNHTAQFDRNTEIQFRSSDSVFFRQTYGTLRLTSSEESEVEGLSDISFQGNRLEWRPALSKGYPYVSSFVIQSHDGEELEIEVHGTDGKVLLDNVDRTEVRIAGIDPIRVAILQGALSGSLVLATIFARDVIDERRDSPRKASVDDNVETGNEEMGD